jgi:hypothetical protein
VSIFIAIPVAGETMGSPWELSGTKEEVEQQAIEKLSQRSPVKLWRFTTGEQVVMEKLIICEIVSEVGFEWKVRPKQSEASE